MSPIAGAIAALADRTRDVNLLINNAGILTFGGILGVPTEAISSQFDTNFYGTLNMVRAFVPVIEQNQGGEIVNLLPLVALASMPGLSVYNASKAAAWSMTQSLRASVAASGQVPVLRVDETILRESLAIIADLDRLQPTPPLLGTDPASTAKIWQWLIDFENHLPPALATIALAIFRNRIESQLEAIASATEIIQIEITQIARQGYLGDRLNIGHPTIVPLILFTSNAKLMGAFVKRSFFACRVTSG
jgi:hypothetical protein